VVGGWRLVAAFK